MKKMILSKRLEALASWVPSGAKLADIGTDHAYLPVFLLQCGKISRAIATDIRKGPLEHAGRTGEEYGVSEVLDLRLCDGLSGVCDEEVDTVVIAGMGGETIAAILSSAPWTKKGVRLLLQPQSRQDVLRRFLSREDYAICEEKIVIEQGKYYTLMQVTGGKMSVLSPAEEFVGLPDTWAVQPERTEYLKYVYERARFQLDKVIRSSKASDEERKGYLKSVISGLEEMAVSVSADLLRQEE